MFTITNGRVRNRRGAAIMPQRTHVLRSAEMETDVLRLRLLRTARHPVPRSARTTTVALRLLLPLRPPVPLRADRSAVLATATAITTAVRRPALLRALPSALPHRLPRAVPLLAATAPRTPAALLLADRRLPSAAMLLAKPSAAKRILAKSLTGFMNRRLAAMPRTVARRSRSSASTTASAILKSCAPSSTV
jgi:hypothetical protein